MALPESAPSGDPGDATLVDLDEWLDRVDSEDIDYDEPAAAPEEATRANAFLGVINRLNRQQRLDDTIAAVEVEKIYRWLTRRTQARQHRIEWLKASLDAFMRITERRDKVRSVTLPNGRLRLSKPTERVVVDDEAAFMDWAGANLYSALIRPKDPEVDKVTLKQQAKASGFKPHPDDPRVTVSTLTLDGEVVPGVHMERDALDRFGIGK